MCVQCNAGVLKFISGRAKGSPTAHAQGPNEHHFLSFFLNIPIPEVIKEPNYIWPAGYRLRTPDVMLFFQGNKTKTFFA